MFGLVSLLKRFFLPLGIFLLLILASNAGAQTPAAGIQDQEPLPKNLDEVKKAIRLPFYYPYDGMSMRVVCHILVDEMGNPQEWVILGRTDFMLGYKVNQQIKNLRFHQAIVKGQVIKAWVMVPIYFTLPELVDSVKKHEIKPGEKDFGPDRIYHIDRFESDLDSIPSEYYNFKNLEVLLLNRNDISKLPDAICKLQELRVLSIQENKIEKLPSCLNQLNHLEYLFLGDNSLNIDRAALQKQLPHTQIIWDRAFDNPDK